MAVAAQFDLLPQGRNTRGTARHQVRLRASSAPQSGEPADVLIHNLSATGMLLESASPLAVDDEIMVDLPEAGGRIAKVVWASGEFFGCAFDRPLPSAAVSAAQLRGEPALDRQERREVAGQISPSSDETFGARLQRLRRERGLTLVEFARRAKVSRPTVWSWEAGRSTPRRSKTPVILQVLGISEVELFGTPDNHDAPPRNVDAHADSLQRAISEAKERVAELAGTSAKNIKLIIEV